MNALSLLRSYRLNFHIHAIQPDFGGLFFQRGNSQRHALADIFFLLLFLKIWQHPGPFLSYPTIFCFHLSAAKPARSIVCGRVANFDGSGRKNRYLLALTQKGGCKTHANATKSSLCLSRTHTYTFTNSKPHTHQLPRSHQMHAHDAIAHLLFLL